MAKSYYMKKPATSKMRNKFVYPNLKRWMDFNGVNARQLAVKIGVANSTLIDYLEGRTQSIKLIKKLKQATGLRYEDLIEKVEG